MQQNSVSNRKIYEYFEGEKNYHEKFNKGFTSLKQQGVLLKNMGQLPTETNNTLG